jgi:hypothetical protein
MLGHAAHRTAYARPSRYSTVSARLQKRTCGSRPRLRADLARNDDVFSPVDRLSPRPRSSTIAIRKPDRRLQWPQRSRYCRRGSRDPTAAGAAAVTGRACTRRSGRTGTTRLSTRDRPRRTAWTGSLYWAGNLSAPLMRRHLRWRSSIPSLSVQVPGSDQSLASGAAGRSSAPPGHTVSGVPARSCRRRAGV